RALAAEAEKADADAVTAEMVHNAEWVAGIKLSDDERKRVAASMTGALRDFAAMHKAPVGNDVPPALHFIPEAAPPAAGRGKGEPTKPKADEKKPDKDEDLAFLPLARLAELVRTRQVTSTELTRLYLARLKEYDPALLCVVTLTEELALEQAAAADRD